MNFIANSFKILPQLGLHLELVSIESIGIFLLPDFLFFITNFQNSQVLFQFTLIDSIFIFNILDGDLRLLLKLCKSIEILEKKMLGLLPVDLLLDLMSFFQILEFPLFISKISLSVF